MFSVPDEVCIYFEQDLSPEKLNEYHQAAVGFFLNYLTDISMESGLKLPDNMSDRRRFLLGSNGVMDLLLHQPQKRRQFNSMVCAAVSLYGHLYCLGEYTEAATIANMVCFALSRQGERESAIKILLQSKSFTHGLINLVTRVNLASLIREEANLSLALKIYRGAIPGLIMYNAKIQLIQVYGEIGSIHRQNGNYLAAVICLEICSILHGWVRNRQGQAIARSQLASVYRSMGLYLLALNRSKQAVAYFRKSNDYLNLGRSLLTCGNILYKSRKGNQALQCFDEALSIGKLISDPQSICGAMSGRARVLMFQKNLTEVKDILDEVISIRHRNSDHSVGIEYENMGQYYELIANDPLALVWYQKALKSVRQYMPGEVGHCERKVDRLERKLRK